MIENATQPQQILVVDDNQEWLNSLAALGINTFNFYEQSKIHLVNFIKNNQSNLSVVVVNLNILQTISSSRIDNLGASLVDSVLDHCPPHLQYIFVSFFHDTKTKFRCLNYIDFLEIINNNG